jgi:hypothetical protein
MDYKTANKRDDVVGYCEICGYPIYLGDKYYSLPDGSLVCDEIGCLDEWAKDYERR